MRYPASEKLEIIRLVEQSHLPMRRTLEKLGIQPARFYRWYDRLQTGGPEALEDKSPRPKRVWNRIPEAIRERIIQLALDEPELSPRELATRFTDTANYFVSEGWQIGWVHRRWVTFAARLIIRRHRARSSAGIKRSRTASCWKIIICQEISKPASTGSSITTSTGAIMKA